MATINSSGLGGLENTPLARIGYSRYIVQQGWETDFIQDITNSQWDSELTKCHQTVQIMVEPDVGDWRNYEKSQTLVHDEFPLRAITFTVCNSIYKAVGFDNQTILYACDNWPAFEQSFTTNIYKVLSMRWKNFVLTRMIAEASRYTKGTQAGAGCDINLGAPGAPRVVDKTNIFELFSSAARALMEQRRWEDGKMWAVIPYTVRELIMNSPLFHSFKEFGDGNQDVLRKGQIPGTLAGFNLYVSQEIPFPDGVSADGRAEYVIFGNSEAFVFVGDVIEARIKDPSGSFTRLYQTQAVYDGMALLPNALAVAYVKIA